MSEAESPDAPNGTGTGGRSRRRSAATHEPATRRPFEAARTFPLDPFQVRALDALDEGRSVLVAAPTGSGKTVVAEYAVALALGAGAKAFYTTPLKALSNQKYADLSREHGAANVGLLTGDNAVNGDAPAVVMTTEVLRNMVYARSPTLHGLRWVVLDEVHYLQNPYRGAVWEEVIIHLPRHVGLVCLSATVSNAEEFADWLRTVRGDTTVVIEERRPVDLTNLYLIGERGNDTLHLLPTFVADDHGEPRPNPEAARLDARGARDSGRRGGGRGNGPPGRGGRLRAPRRADYVEMLAAEQMLPAISFVFSRAGCDQAVGHCVAAGLRLTDGAERAEIRRIADARTESLTDDDLDALGAGEWRHGLECGFAAHHAGMVPPMKEAVEEAFAAGLVKVVFATETLSLGINMPARSVVIEKLSKFTGERHEFLTPGEYTQLTGRAGRRGIDDRGYAVVCWSPFVPFDQLAGLASRRTYALTSSFRPTYNMTANLVHRYESEQAHHLLNLSFAQYRADRDVVAIERRLERDRELLARHLADAECERGGVDEYRALLAAVDSARREARAEPRIPAAIAALRPGDVLVVPRGHGRVVVLKQDHGRGGPRVLALGAGRELVRLGASDFDIPPRAATTIDLPRPYQPRNPAFRRAAADALRKARPNPDVGDAAPTGAEAPDPSRHPVAACPERSRHLKAATAAERLTRDVTRLERRVRSRNESLARQFDRVHRVLEAWDYLDGWTLTDGGRLLMRIYSECDLVVAEALRRGLFDGLNAPEFAGLASCFSYERRGADGAPTRAPTTWPSAAVSRRFREIDRIRQDLIVNEDDAGLPETRAPDPGLSASMHDWAAGTDLAAILDDDEELTGGDFVRNVKQCIDLLRQIGDVAPLAETAATARVAADACFRGVVAASSVVNP
ncbi:MAG: DEAD/DEAH box helicase [Acidimicrobiia bacterium]